MTDTPVAVEESLRALLLQRSGEERLKMGCSMYATARTLVLASLRAREPDASPGALRKTLFLRFYGNDFDLVSRERVLKVLEEVRGEAAG